jgi:hypothetical protein
LFRKTSSPGVVVIRRDTDGYRWDFTNTVFSATPALDYLAPTEDSAFPGMYVLEVTQTWSGLYQLFWYPSSAKTGKPAVYSINLTSGVETDPYAALADSVRAEMDASSTQLAAILADTGTTLPTTLATIDGIVDAILLDTGTDGVVLANDTITSAKFDQSTAHPLAQADTGATAVARTGADSDTLETISDQLDAAVLDGVLFLGDTQIA